VKIRNSRSLAETKGFEQLSPYETAPFTEAESFHSVSRPLVKSITETLTANQTTRLKSPLCKGLLMALISIPIWLLIVFLSPLDAYVAARNTVEQR
jgi:hypothetical protein